MSAYRDGHGFKPEPLPASLTARVELEEALARVIEACPGVTVIELGSTRYEEALAAAFRAEPASWPPAGIWYCSATGQIALVHAPSAGPLDVIAKKIDEKVDAVPRRR